MAIKNLLSAHVQTVVDLGFRVDYEGIYERLYHLGEPIPEVVFAALEPTADDLTLLRIQGEDYALSLTFWAPKYEGDSPLMRVNFHVRDDYGDFNEDPFLHEYINVIEAVGVLRLKAALHLLAPASSRNTAPQKSRGDQVTKQEIDDIDKVHRKCLGQDHAANAVCALVDEVRRLNEQLYRLRCDCGKSKDDLSFARTALKRIRDLADDRLTNAL